MKRTRIAFVLLVLLALAACDGGARGSGITTAQGNVESIQTALRAPSGVAPKGERKSDWLAWLRHGLWLEGRAEADAGIGGIRVLLEGTTIEDETASDGSFTLRGHFEGDVSIRFERDASAPPVRIALNAPARGVLTLSDVRIDETTGSAAAQSTQVEFDGLVVSADCPAGTAELISRYRSTTDTDVYPTRLDTSFVHDAAGAAIPCEALQPGDAVRFRGFIDADGTFGNADIERIP